MAFLPTGNLRPDRDKPSHLSADGSHDRDSRDRDNLFVGTQSTLLAYDVQRNADSFFRDVPDGVNALTVSRLGSTSQGAPLVFAGGNCSVLGFNNTGAEAFWTVAGDNVTALTSCDVNDNGSNELIVGSEDYEIRVFENEELVSEQTEADKVTHLCALEKTVFCYGLANGSVGVYSGPKNRLWRVKTKHQVRFVARCVMLVRM